MVEMGAKQQEYGASAKMTVEIDGEKMTMQKAAQFLKDINGTKERGIQSYQYEKT